jgi:O-antigen/teichoic acid export membrane protein
VAVIAAGAATGQLVVAVASPILTRVYSVQEIGVFAVYASILGTLIPASSLRYEVAIPLPGSDDHARDVTAVALCAVVAVASVAAAAVALFGDALVSVTDAADLDRYLWILPLGLIAAGVYQALSYWGIRRAAFPAIGKARVVQATSQVGGQVTLGVGVSSAAGLGFGDAIGRTAGALSYVVMMGSEDRRLLRGVSRSDMWVQAKRYRRFPLIGTWSALANAAAGHLTPFAVALTFGPIPAGWFTVGLRVMALPVTILGQAVSQVYLHRAAETSRRSASDLRGPFLEVTKKLLAVGVVTVVPLGLSAPFFFPIVFGSAWREAGVYMLLAIPMFYAQLVVSPLSQTLNVLGRQGTLLAWDIARVGLIGAAFAAATVLDWKPAFTVGVYAGAIAAAYIVLWYVMLRSIDRAEGLPA